MRRAKGPERTIMNVNGITGISSTYSAYQQTADAAGSVSNSTTDAAAASVEATEDASAVYEPRLEIPTATYKANEVLISKLKEDVQDRLDTLQNIVQQLISKQSNAYANATDIWSTLREGNFEVDPETKAQAQKDIADDGYWGVEQTSDRILDFAVALTGGDTSKLSDMLDAFKKGYSQAEETWGGELPEISQKTYDAVIEKFNNLMESET